MYELKQGTVRLVSALYRRIEDPAALQRIAAATDYLPQQLKEDIQALHDYVYNPEKLEIAEMNELYDYYREKENEL